MEKFDKVVVSKFRTPSGNLYKLTLSPYETLSEIEVSVMEVLLERLLFVEDENPMKVFHFVVEQIRYFLQEKEVILFYYCDGAGIYYRNNAKRKFVSSQHFRSELFYTLFKKENLPNIEIERVVFENPATGNHYISFIFNQKHAYFVDILLKEMQVYEK